MSSDSPTPWEVTTELMGNIREAQRRAEKDSLRLALVTAGFLVLSFSATDQIAVAGVVVSDPSIVLYGLLPYAALLALSFVKAQELTTCIARRLRIHMHEDQMDVPREAYPMDWDALRDRTRALGFPKVADVVGPAMVWAAVLLGWGLSLREALQAGEYFWFVLASVATAGVVVLSARSAWHTSFLGAPEHREHHCPRCGSPEEGHPAADL
ncbi:hypothetical protein IEZ26_06610 [Nocardioides cavernae]|uniref:Uncharacterized protein n=1 Tax=Nocardioides cavernae TaxID=1921566 RepID=A0ABR8N813_9ACTN|nr:hypothetical protein [Nocardioides cavernae]MBD3924287.1 hypothetical protein [Nocardioides cavernae]MBM7510771.1 hypothetical protein [Nocardioides cavernae]